MGECLMFGLDLESRALCSVYDEDSVRFLIGTTNIKMDNQICLLSVESDCSRISSASFPHPRGEVRSLAASPQQPLLLAAATADYRSSSAQFGVHLYMMDNDRRQLIEQAAHSAENCPISFEWEPQTNVGCALYEDSLELFDIKEGLKMTSSLHLNGAVHSQSWSPHNGGSTLGVAVDRKIVCYDTRTMTSSLQVNDAHLHRALHLDFNPNLQHVMASCGDDGAVRLWDWRRSTTPLLTLRPHAHWAWQVRFHPVHDQLILSTGSDACVVLSCVQSVSSESETMDDEEGAEKLDDGQLERIDEHEESVYACAWSHGDPWTFASLSHDGRTVVSKVKRKHKYALMQL